MLGNYGAADALTLNGVARFVAGNMERQARDEVSASDAVGRMLNSFTFDASQLPYHRDLATTMYDVGLSGDGDELVNRASSSSAPSSSWWGDIIKPFVTQIGMGAGGRIAGVNPWAGPPVVLPPAPGMPTWAKVALAAGGVLVGGVILSSVLKRRR